MNKITPIQDESSYVKDNISNAIINKDLNMLAEYKSRRNFSKQIASLQNEINILKEELNKIKTHLNVR